MSAPQAKVALWEDVALRTIAVYKIIHGLFFIAVGFGLLKLRHHNPVDFLMDHVILPYHLNPESHLIYWILTEAEKVTSHKLSIIGYALFFYAALFLAEGIGLYLRKRWAEYVVVIVTGSLLPFEFYEIYLRVAWWKFIVVFGNVLILLYLIHRIRLDTHNAADARANQDELPRANRPQDHSSPPGDNDRAVADAKSVAGEVR